MDDVDALRRERDNLREAALARWGDRYPVEQERDALRKERDALAAELALLRPLVEAVEKLAVALGEDPEWESLSPEPATVGALQVVQEALAKYRESFPR